MATSKFPPLRQEAAVLLEGELFDDQRKAINEVFAIVAAAMKAADHAPDPRKAGIDDEYAFLSEHELRHSNVAVIDGTRGSGKTSVLQTVLDALANPLRENRLPPEGAVKLPSDLAKKFVVPLRAFDLNPLPEDASLHSWLIQVFRRVVEKCEPDGGPDPLGLEPERGPRRKSPHAAWRKLVRAAAVGWGEAKASERADMEGHIHVAETIGQEQADLRLAWREFIDCLVCELPLALKRKNNDLPLFLVPIDDLDMRPKFTARILQLMRTFEHPRVLFLATGDIELMEVTLMRHFYRQLTAKGLDQGHDVHRNARRLATNTLIKVVARSMCVELPTLPCAERLARLRGALSQIQLEAGQLRWAPHNMAEFFDAHPTTMCALPDRPRFIADMLLWLETPRDAQSVAEHLWSLAVTSSDVSERMRQSLRRAITVPPLIVSGLGVEAMSDRYLGIGKALDGGYFLQVASKLEMQLRFVPPMSEAGTPARAGDLERLPSQPCAALFLGASLVGMTPESTTRGASLSPIAALMNYVEAGSLLRSTLAPRVPWLAPDFATPFEWDLMNSHWVKNLGVIRPAGPSETLDPESLLRHFLASVFAVDPNISVGANGWEWLVEPVRGMRNKTPQNPVAVAWNTWAQFRLPLLCAPESGLPQQVADALFATLSRIGIGAGWPPDAHLQRVHGAREERMAWGLSRLEEQSELTRLFPVSEAGHPQLDRARLVLEEIDAASGSFEFVKKYRDPAAPRAGGLG